MTTKVIASLLAVAVGWIAVLAGVMLVSDAAPAALVLFPSEAFLNALPDDVGIVSTNAFSATFSSQGTGITAALYDAGAIMVLPAGLLGCAPLTS